MKKPCANNKQGHEIRATSDPTARKAGVSLRGFSRALMAGLGEGAPKAFLLR